MTESSTDRLEVIYRSIEELTPYGANARTHTDHQISQVMASINEFGWTNPILLRDDSSLVAGHARLEAAKRLGLTEVPTISLANLTEDQARAYVIADNQLATNAGWDEAILAGELVALQEAGFNIDVVGFSDQDIAALLAPRDEEGFTDPDDAPPLQDDPISKVGDVWLLGSHRLVCGDCTVPEFVDHCLDGARPNLMVTDPPYGVNYDPSHRVRSGLAKRGQVAEGKVMNDDRADWREAWVLFPGIVAYVWHAGTKAHIVSDSLESVGFDIRSQIVWVKNRFAISRGHYHVQHEPCFEAGKDADYEHETAQYACRSGEAASWAGDRKQSTVWFIAHRANDTGHGTQKPVECMERPIRNNSSPGQGVYDPFCGSGTTIIACQRTGRVCYAIELDERYVDVIVRRWEAYTRKSAVLEETGQTFADVVRSSEKRKGDAAVTKPESESKAKGALKKKSRKKVSKK